jgi:hypothetical protein
MAFVSDDERKVLVDMDVDFKLKAPFVIKAVLSKKLGVFVDGIADLKDEE